MLCLVENNLKQDYPDSPVVLKLRLLESSFKLDFLFPLKVFFSVNLKKWLTCSPYPWSTWKLGSWIRLQCSSTWIRHPRPQTLSSSQLSDEASDKKFLKSIFYLKDQTRSEIKAPRLGGFLTPKKVWLNGSQIVSSSPYPNNSQSIT